MRADANDPDFTESELTPAERLQTLGELLVIGLQRSRKRPQPPPEPGANSAAAQTLRIPHE